MILEDLEKIYDCLNKKNLSFCFYRLPDAKEITLVAGSLMKNASGFSDENQSGFVFRPFDKEGEIRIIQPYFAGNIIDFSEDFFDGFPDGLSKESKVDPKEAIQFLSKEAYLLKVGEVIEEIKKGTLEKLVFSRAKRLKNRSSAISLFHSILSDHPSTFNYLLRTGEGQIWFGASPEMILQKEQLGYRTVALAGTVRNENIEDLFSAKNVEEQQFVTDFISSKLRQHSARNIKVADSMALRASNVSHIKSSITFDLSNGHSKSVMSCVEALHPTPAVAGTPQDEAIKGIYHYESYPRELYAGYLGPLNVKGKTAFYVNLRSAQYFPDEVVMYVGGGITKDSDPLMEWEETENKSELITKVVRCNP